MTRLRDVVLEKQREREGIIAPKAVREAAQFQLDQLVTEYREDLLGIGRKPKHVHDSTTRIERIFRETGWKRLGDIRVDQFSQWRAGVGTSAKTKKEYQISLNAFLNWLVRSDRLLINPLQKLETVETRGKQVRESRAYSDDELKRLFAVAGKRLLAYQVLLYTGQRKSEVRAVVWGDLHLDEEKPYALFREATTKDKDKRAVPLHPRLVEALKSARPVDVDPSKKVFWFCWPTYDILRSDMVKAKIERKDALGRVLHFHSFRKTWQTMGVRFGMNQRAAQEILGHSDANLTAKAYTDVPALGMHTEINKLPWIGNTESEPANPLSLIDSLECGVSRKSASLSDVLRQLILSLQVAGEEELRRVVSRPDTVCANDSLAARAGWNYELGNGKIDRYRGGNAPQFVPTD